jgi:protein arginine kinase activator
MKKCQLCDKPATMHVTDVINHHKQEMYLCESCAREKNLLSGSAQDFNIPAILQMVLGQLPPAPRRSGAGDSVCPECGTPYAHFRAQGRLGCAHEYEAFRSLLEPLLDKVQNGAVRHVGKAPARHRRRMKHARRAEFEAMLATAVASEKYEEAARLRDLIRSLGEEHES